MDPSFGTQFWGEFNDEISAVFRRAVNSSFGVDSSSRNSIDSSSSIDSLNWTSAAPPHRPPDPRDHFLFVVYAVAGSIVNSFGFVGNILTLIVLFSMHPRTSVTLYIIGREKGVCVCQENQTKWRPNRMILTITFSNNKNVHWKLGKQSLTINSWSVFLS